MTARTGTLIGSRSITGLQFGEKIRKVRTLTLYTPATVDATNTISVNYARFGITNILGIKGCKHTTDNSVVVAEDPTSSIVGTTKMTLTVPSGTTDDQRVYKIYYI